MDKKYLAYALYMGLAIVLMLPIFVTPYLADSHPQLFDALHAFYAPSCHQLASRSLCYFQDGRIGDCVQPGMLVSGRERIVEGPDGILGYKFPVCARDMGIYAAMLIGGLLYPFLRKMDDRMIPPIIYFIIALIPIGLDGGTQLIGLRESTNTLRVITGFIAGIAVPFYLIPMLSMFILGRDSNAPRQNRK